MIRKDPQQLDQLIAEMSDDEKLALIEKLSSSMHVEEVGADSGQHLSAVEWMDRVRAWAASHPQREHVDDSRDSIYADRG